MVFRRKKQPDSPRPMPRWMFETRTEAWQEAGLAEEIRHGSTRRSVAQVIVSALIFVAVLVAFDNRGDLFPSVDDTLLRVLTAILLGISGWALALGIGKGLIPAIMRRLDPATAGSVGFLVRLAMIIAIAIVSLRIAGIKAETLALGGAFTAVIVGLAAQQTLGNIFAGIVLQGTRPFRVGERVRLTGGSVAGSIEGTVGSLGLFYTSLVKGADRMMVPNSILLQLTVMPLREPEQVDLRARFDTHVSPAEVQARLRDRLTVPTRYSPHITVEEIDPEQVVFRITATPLRPADGAKLAEEILDITRQKFGNDDGDAGDDSGRKK
jgi:small conductance mechanosensitive channel